MTLMKLNRTFLVFLMIASAMLIAVIGQREPTAHLDAMPWEVYRLENNSLRVFGITLGKTSIQEANQIFASFAETKFQVTIDNNEFQTYQLIADYDELVIGRLLAKIQATYLISQKNLQHIAGTLNIATGNQGKKFYLIDKKTEMKYLNTAIETITYIPSIDYDLETIQQRFGHASEEKQLNEHEKLWRYPEMGLEIYIHDSEPDKFVYSVLNQD